MGRDRNIDPSVSSSTVAPWQESADLSVNLMLNQATLAHQSKALELRFIDDRGMVAFLSPQPLKAEQQIKALLHQGYVLTPGEGGHFYLTRGLAGGSPIDALKKKLDMKPAAQRSIFITYQWEQKEIAKTLHRVLEAQGYLVVRDEDTLNNGAYIKDFMKIIKHRHLDYVLPIISNTYLRSSNCMYEVNQIMMRDDWENSLLPYVVTHDERANAHIYRQGGIVPYKKHWQERLAREKDFEEREILENIARNVGPFATAIASRINVPEAELIATGYKALFNLIGMREKERENTKFREIEELLRIASTAEKIGGHDEAKKSFESAVEKLKTMKHVEGTESMFGQVYGLYGEYLLRQEEMELGEKHLETAKKFNYQSVSTIKGGQLKPDRTRDVLRPGNLENVQSSKSFPVSEQERLKFLRLVAEGEQDQVEKMLQVHRDLILSRGDFVDLSNRQFQGITGFQYAVWALDCHMWTMMLQGSYLSIEEAAALSITHKFLKVYQLDHKVCS